MSEDLAGRLHEAEAKTRDAEQSLVRGWIGTHGDVAWRLDALEPHELEWIIEVAIREQINPNILNERSDTAQKKRERIAEQVANCLSSRSRGWF
jgi:hypothetical protein